VNQTVTKGGAIAAGAAGAAAGNIAGRLKEGGSSGSSSSSSVGSNGSQPQGQNYSTRGGGQSRASRKTPS
ncbi:hypothetical protein D0T84_10260, partial [Dysgonomonas sp. 521]|uniref:hypothetical protein n=1 Tax=Dysgonomonas sp. 521 TaxID=2302932 RepID=UPI001D988831|nr:hypothetical protein [Dysgonomonas sp. 521]